MRVGVLLWIGQEVIFFNRKERKESQRLRFAFVGVLHQQEQEELGIMERPNMHCQIFFLNQ